MDFLVRLLGIIFRYALSFPSRLCKWVVVSLSHPQVRRSRTGMLSSKCQERKRSFKLNN